MRFTTADLPDAPSGAVSPGATAANWPSDPAGKPNVFEISFDSVAIEQSGNDTDGIVIHEVMGHLVPSMEQTSGDRAQATPQSREIDAQERTIRMRCDRARLTKRRTR